MAAFAIITALLVSAIAQADHTAWQKLQCQHVRTMSDLPDLPHPYITVAREDLVERATIVPADQTRRHTAVKTYTIKSDSQDNLSNLHVVLKEFVPRPKEVIALCRELRALIVLHQDGFHPNIIPLIGVARYRQTIDRRAPWYNHAATYVMTKLAPKGALIEVDGAPEVNWLPRVFLDVAFALVHARSKNIFHGDIKPDNIVLDEDGRAQVIDWEMSYTADELGKSRFVVGTPGYIAPEGSVHDIVPFQTPVQLDFHKIQCHIMGRGLCDKSDVFSFGATLLEMIRDPQLICTRCRFDDLRETYRSENWIHDFIDCAEHCMKEEPIERPDYPDVLKEIIEAVSHISTPRPPVHTPKTDKRSRSSFDNGQLLSPPTTPPPQDHTRNVFDFPLAV
ncbi:Protein kinase domain-containing protein [Plasmodiophora brassicae]